jgi:hypothetical protein
MTKLQIVNELPVRDALNEVTTEGLKGTRVEQVKSPFGGSPPTAQICEVPGIEVRKGSNGGMVGVVTLTPVVVQLQDGSSRYLN